MRAILAGGPRHGAIYEVDFGRDLVFAVNFPVSQLFMAGIPSRPPRPKWHQMWNIRAYQAWKNWKESGPPEYTEPAFERIVYRLKWRLSSYPYLDSGGIDAIYWYEGAATAPFETANEIFHYLATRRMEVMYANHGMLNDRHWEMGRDWFNAIWNATLSGQPVIFNDPLAAQAMLIGLPVKVTGLTGAPRIVRNEKVEAIHG